MKTTSLQETIDRIRAGQRSVAEEFEATRSRIEAADTELRSFVEVATELPPVVEDGPLHGVPIGVKDIIDVAGYPTRCGSSITDPAPVTTTAACVQRLVDLGAVVVGKSVTTEFAYFAPGPTRNPAAAGRTPGGSSSGSAAAVAAGLVPLALGSQTAGSLTRPASFCGVSGMVLAHGSVDLSGVTGLSPSLDSLGLITRTVADLEIVHRAFTGDATTVTGEPAFLVWSGSELGEIDPAMTRLIDALAADLAADHEVAPLDWDDHVHTLTSDHLIVMGYEAAREHPELLAEHRDALSAPLVQLLAEGAETTHDQYEGARYRRDRSRLDLAERMPAGTVLIGPAAPGPAPEGLEATGSPVLSRAWQLLGLPVITVAGATTTDGLPLGVQVIGWPGREADLLAAAALVEDRVRGMTVGREESV
ncbi:amidase [Enemella sp. A6]|uniref:amidase n=1 Tax=Enemella sp. A6 TaxID=3440152 RepID=UPI003EBE6171